MGTDGDPGPRAPGGRQGPPPPTKHARSLMAPRGPGAQPDRTRRRGHGALASSGARAARAPVPGPAREAGPGLRGRSNPIFVVFAVLQLVLSALATTTGQDRVLQQRRDIEECKWNVTGNCCPPGFYLSEDIVDCISRKAGMDFSNHEHNLSVCLSQGGSGEEQKRWCSRIADMVCQCRPDACREGNVTDMCRLCSRGCPDGTVQAQPCNPWSNLKCVKPESGISAVMIGVVALLVVVAVVVLACCICYRRSRTLQARGMDPKRVDRLFSWWSCPPRGPGAQDDAHNQIVNNRNSQSTLDSEQQLEQQEHAELTHVIAPSPEEAKCLLGPAEARRVSDENQVAVSNHGVGPQ